MFQLKNEDLLNPELQSRLILYQKKDDLRQRVQYSIATQMEKNYKLILNDPLWFHFNYEIFQKQNAKSTTLIKFESLDNNYITYI